MSGLKFKVGDKVRVKSRSWMKHCPDLIKNYDSEAIYSKIEGEENCINSPMQKLAGEIATIVSINCNSYRLDIDDHKYNWYDWMLESELSLEQVDIKSLDISKQYWLVSRESDGDYALDRVAYTSIRPKLVNLVKIDYETNKIYFQFPEDNINRSIEFYSEQDVLLDRLFCEEFEAIAYWNYLIEEKIREFNIFSTKYIKQLELSKLE